MNDLVGKQHEDLLAWLNGPWLNAGPPVCVIEGAPGVGKTTAARALVESCDRDAVHVPFPDSAERDDLLLELAAAMEIRGRSDLADVLAGKDLDRALARALQRPVLLVVDEFQRALDDRATPGKEILRLLENAGRHRQALGRLLLLTSQRVETTSWVERQGHRVRPLDALEDDDASKLLETLLTETKREDDIAASRRREVVRWVGGNPRALKVVVGALAYGSLDNLIKVAPKAWETRDREIDPDLLQKLEEALLRRTLERLPDDERVLLRQLSVHRKAVKSESLDRLLDGDKARSATMRKRLIDLFLVDQHGGWFQLHPIVRDVCLRQLDDADLRAAHGRAADDYLRHFQAKGHVDERRLGGHYVEVRYHLVHAKRAEDLRDVMNLFGKRLRDLYGMTSPVPKTKEELDERIAVLSAYLEKGGPKGLEYYLARLLKHRGSVGDPARALRHARRATGPQASDQAWRSRILLENEVVSVEQAIEVAKQAVKALPTDEHVIQLLGELLSEANRLDEAVDVLREGLGKVPPEYNLFSLYQSLGETLVQAERLDEAVDVLREGLEKVPSSSSAAPKRGPATVWTRSSGS